MIATMTSEQGLHPQYASRSSRMDINLYVAESEDLLIPFNGVNRAWSRYKIVKQRMPLHFLMILACLNTAYRSFVS